MLFNMCKWVLKRVSCLSVDDVDDGAALVKHLFSLESGVEKVDLAGKVPDGELDERRIVYLKKIRKLPYYFRENNKSLYSHSFGD